MHRLAIQASARDTPICRDFKTMRRRLRSFHSVRWYGKGRIGAEPFPGITTRQCSWIQTAAADRRLFDPGSTSTSLDGGEVKNASALRFLPERN
jgi:hypothetical protein